MSMPAQQVIQGACGAGVRSNVVAIHDRVKPASAEQDRHCRAATSTTPSDDPRHDVVTPRFPRHLGTFEGERKRLAGGSAHEDYGAAQALCALVALTVFVAVAAWWMGAL